jgi:fibronectin type 3 domain-containing protein
LLPWVAAIAAVPAIAVSALAASTPQTPTGLTAPTPTNTSPALRWNAASGATSYVVYRGSTAVANVRSTSYTDTGARASGSYVYTVRSYNGQFSGPSTPFTVLVDTLRPSNVAAPTGTSPTRGSPSLTWPAASDSGGSGVKRYEVSRNGTVVGTATTTSFTDSGVTADGSYSYAVVAVDGAGNRSQSPSPAKTIVVDRTAPAQPAAPVPAEAETANAPSLSWAPSSDPSGIASYRVLRNGTQVGTPTTTSFTDSALRSAGSYSYTVVAVDGAGNASSPSNGATVWFDPTPPSAPTGLAAATSGTVVSLSWNAATDDSPPVTYRVFRDGAQITTTGQLSYDDTPSQGSHSYTVSAVDRLGNVSAQSAPVTVNLVTDTTAPSVPLGPFARASGNGNVISWALSTDAGTGVSGYQIWNGGNLVGTPTAPPFTDPSGARGDTYTVKAVDGAGNVSGASLAATAGDPFPTGIAARLSTDSSTSEYGLHPQLEIISVMLRWKQVEPAADTFNWGNLDTSLADATAHGYKLVIRIMCGADAPSWLATDAHAVEMLDLLSTDPSNTRYPGEMFVPVPWDPDLAYHYQNLISALQQHLLQSDGAGGTWADHVEFVPIAMPTVQGTEMQVGYGTGTYTGTYKGQSGTFSRATENQNEWNAHAPSGTTPAEKQQANRDAIEAAWRQAIRIHLDTLTAVPSAIAYGALLGDQYAAAQDIARTEISAARTNLWSMTTNLQPKVRADGTLGPWSEWNPQAAQTIRLALQNGGIIGFQSPGSGVIDTAAKVQAMVDDGIDNYNMRFLETASETIESYASILIGSPPSAQGRLQARFGKG